MRVRSSLADHLVQPHSSQATHDTGAHHKSEKERSDCCSGGAERYPLEQSQKSKVRQPNEWDE
jgi:hypothetical protein